MDWTIVTTAAPAAEPVSVAEAKAQCRVDGTDSDTEIAALISAARKHVELYTGQRLVTQTLQLRTHYLAGDVIALPVAPISAVTSITYTDTDGVSQTLDTDTYYTVLDGLEPKVALAYSEVWPSQRVKVGGVVVTVTAGYGNAAAVSAAVPDMVHAIKLLVGHWFANREAVGAPQAELPHAVDALLANHRRF